MPRRTKLTPDMQKEIVNALMTGATVTKVCGYVGIHKSTFYTWLARGRSSKRGDFIDFTDAVTRAHAHAHIKATGALTSAMLPSLVTTDSTQTTAETRLRTIKHKDGTLEKRPYEYRKTIQRHSISTQPGDWRAAVEFLKRRDPANWSATITLSVDVKLVKDAIEALEELGQNPATVFNAIIARAKAKRDASAGKQSA